MGLSVITPVAVHIACVTVRADNLAVAVLAQLGVVTLENLQTALELGGKQFWHCATAGFGRLCCTYTVVDAVSLVVRDVCHVARVAEDDDRNNCFN